ncbi:MAG: 2-oxo acid dehydrogenase subunit E2 [Aigarchaeota archaeon]|nr:2-oxo acid dehydrogenase subunit E2 [Candidatus Pelearchaeum maunauluense]
MSGSLKQVIMPRIDPVMESGRIVRWLKREGERVARGEALVVVEGEKTTFEVESPADGVLSRIVHGEDEEVKVGDVLAEIEATEAAIEETAQPRREVRASPLARRLAREHGISLEDIRGTGPGGLITREDVMRVISGARVEEKPEKTTKLTGLRKTIAERMSKSFHTSAPVALTTEFNATNLMKKYESLKQKYGDAAPSITSIIVKVCAGLLRENQEFNAILEDDVIKLRDEVNISVAVDTPAGLYAPVIRDADKLSLLEIEKRLRELREKALAGQLKPEELYGHTFTITNLGGEGVLFFTPILNPPAILILGVGAITKKPIAVGEEIRLGDVGHLSLVFDHRAVDGAPAARFLAKIKQRLESMAGDLD